MGGVGGGDGGGGWKGNEFLSIISQNAEGCQVVLQRVIHQIKHRGYAWNKTMLSVLSVLPPLWFAGLLYSAPQSRYTCPQVKGETNRHAKRMFTKGNV